MGDVIAVGNLKGGTGKSTIAVNLACMLAVDGSSVVLVDADGQATASDWHGGGRVPVTLEALPLGSERGAQKWVARVLGLKAAFDHVVVDLPPQVGSGIASALLIADLLLVPVTPSAVDLRATGKALDLLHRARAVRAGHRPGCMLVPSRVDRRTQIGRSIHATLARFGLRVGPAVRQRAVHADAFRAGAWIGHHAPTSPAFREIRLLGDRVRELMDEIDRQAAGPVRPRQPAADLPRDPGPLDPLPAMPFGPAPAGRQPEVRSPGP